MQGGRFLQLRKIAESANILKILKADIGYDKIFGERL